MSNLTLETAQVEIKNATYAVEPIPAGEFGSTAVRVTKLVNGETYDVIRGHDNIVTCSCPDFIFRHEGNGTHCKHASAMLARGFLDTPPVVASIPPTFTPVSDLDRKRASYFGLKIPATPAPVEPVVVEANPRDSWPAWTDEVWTITPAVEEAPKAEAWLAETVALFLTGLAVEMIETGEVDGALELYHTSEPENRTAFDAFTSGEIETGDWLGWLNLVQFGCPVSFPEPSKPAPSKPRGQIEKDGPRPSVFYGTIQTREQEAEAVELLNNPRPIAPPRRPRPVLYTMPNNNLTDADIYPLGCVS